MSAIVKHEGDAVNVYAQGWRNPLLTIRDYGRGPQVGICACLTGTFDEAEDLAKAYVAAFELARSVPVPNNEMSGGR